MRRPHLEEDLLERYAMDGLQEQSLEAVEEHLLVCTDCQQRLSELDEFVAAFKAAAVQQRTPRPVPAWRRPRMIPVFAGLGAAAVIVALLLMGGAGYQGTAPIPATVIELHAFRGTEAGVRAPAGRPVVLAVDVPAPARSAKYRVEILDLTGRSILMRRLKTSGGPLRVPVSSLARGQYWVRVYEEQPRSELLEEYSLRAIGEAPADERR